MIDAGNGCRARFDRNRIVKSELVEQSRIGRIWPWVKVLRTHVDDELMAVEFDRDAADVAANRVVRLEQDDVASAIEQPGQRDAGHPAADDANRAPGGGSVEAGHRQRGACRERKQYVPAIDQRGHARENTPAVSVFSRPIFAPMKRVF